MSKVHNSNKWHKVSVKIKRYYKGICANPFGLHTNKGMIADGNLVAASVIHHIIPAEIAPSKFLEFSNLIPLCDKCHELAHLLLGSIDGRKEYARTFKVDLNLLSKNEETQTQNFFIRKECTKNAAGMIFCRRMGKYKDKPCACCSVGKNARFSKYGNAEQDTMTADGGSKQKKRK